MEKRYRQRKHRQWLERLPIEKHYNRVIDKCTDYLQQKLTTSNCIDMLMFAHNHGLERLYRLTASFIDVHFERVFTSDEFFELTIDQMITLMPLLIYDEMTESDMENALQLWYKYKRIERKKCVNLKRPNYKSWLRERVEQREKQHQEQTMSAVIKTEPNDVLAEPLEPTEPAGASEPADPADPTETTAPVDPSEPAEPAKQAEASEPAQQDEPTGTAEVIPEAPPPPRISN